MRKLFGIYLLLLSISSCSLKSDYVNQTEQKHNRQLASLLDPGSSPLNAAEIKQFKGITHFPVSELYKVEAVINWLPSGTPFDMAHTGGDIRPYMKVAELHFNIDGKPFSLMAYQTEKMRTQRTLFVPFADITNGSETYGGGRYLDISYAPNASKTEIDFNLAYYPYCAYSHRYSCPVVPSENSLSVNIRAGEKDKTQKL